MIAYLLFTIVCLLLAFFVGSMAFWLWSAGTVAIVAWSILRDLVFRPLYSMWDRATTDDGDL